jgi:D-glycero-alpha-D-manno-heptose-7-phosphate kinase
MSANETHKNFHVTATAPVRIDLAGGTIDLWPIHQVLDEKATVNCAVQLPARVEVKASGSDKYLLKSLDQGIEVSGSFIDCVQTEALPLVGLFLGAWWRKDLPPLEITLEAKSPAGAGLGGSSCLAVTLGGALLRTKAMITGKNIQIDEYRLVQTASDIEARLIHAPTGIQDYWGAVRGGLNIIEFPAGRVTIETHDPSGVNPAAHVTRRLEEELLLCFSGKSRRSAINNWEIFKRVFDGDKTLLGRLAEIGRVSKECASAVRQGDYDRMLEHSAREWGLRCDLWPDIHSDETRRQADAAINAGAKLARVCGAGGGGVMAIVCPRERQSAVREALQLAGGHILPAGVARRGLEVNDH